MVKQSSESIENIKDNKQPSQARYEQTPTSEIKRDAMTMAILSSAHKSCSTQPEDPRSLQKLDNPASYASPDATHEKLDRSL
jgi:hypothetical protein